LFTYKSVPVLLEPPCSPEVVDYNKSVVFWRSFICVYCH